MSFEIQIPYQDRSQTIADALANGVERALPVEDQPVATQLLLQTSGKTIGELLDRVGPSTLLAGAGC